MNFPELCQEIRRAYTSCPSYSALWRAVMTASVPARREKRGWQFDAEAIPAIAEKFGLEKIER